MEICLRVIKESNKSRFDSHSRQEFSVLNISHTTFRDCRVHIFPTTFLEIVVYIHVYIHTHMFINPILHSTDYTDVLVSHRLRRRQGETRLSNAGQIKSYKNYYLLGSFPVQSFPKLRLSIDRRFSFPENVNSAPNMEP